MTNYMIWKLIGENALIFFYKAALRENVIPELKLFTYLKYVFAALSAKLFIHSISRIKINYNKIFVINSFEKITEKNF